MRVRTIISIIFAIALIAIASPRADLAQKKKNVTRHPAPAPTTVFALPQAQISAVVNSTGEVTFRGSGYAANEAVSINVQTDTEGILGNVLLGTWTVYADPTGTFTSGWAMTDLAGSYIADGSGLASARSATVSFLGPEAAVAANLDQCANGPLGSPVQCVSTNWENGNLNENKAHYFEGEAIVYRLRFSGLDTALPHAVTIEWDTTENSRAKHAIDYVVSYDFSETDAVPCSGVAGCDPSVFDTYPIPPDPFVAAGNDAIPGSPDDIVQAEGVFTLFGGDITGVSTYTRDAPYTGASKTRITIFFTTAVADPVLAWGGHISRRIDWGYDHSAISIPGSPYHTRLIDIDGTGGNQDRSLSASAVIFPATVTIIKDAQPNTLLPFEFTATGQPGLSPFTLVDDGDPATTTPDVSIMFSNLAYFGTLNKVVVTEAPTGNLYGLSDVTCTSEAHGGAGTNNYTFSFADRNVSITLEEGESVTCTFVNLYTGPTAGYATITGRVMNSSGRGIYRAAVGISSLTTGESRYVYTNSFGYYRITDMRAGEDYLLSVSAKSYSFSPSSVVLNLTDDVEALNFKALP